MDVTFCLLLEKYICWTIGSDQMRLCLVNKVFSSVSKVITDKWTLDFNFVVALVPIKALIHVNHKFVALRAVCEANAPGFYLNGSTIPL